MLRLLSRLSLIFAALLLLASSLQAQAPGSGAHRVPGGNIDVQVRYADGRPAPVGIHVRLESAEGGAEADLMTIPGGKCQFHLGSNGVFVVRISESEYKEVSERVEIIGNPMAYVVLTLIPVRPETKPAVVVPATESTEPISVKDLTIPEQARDELTKGEEALSAKNPDESRKHLQKAIKLYPDYSPQ